MLKSVSALIQARYSSNLYPGRSMVKIAGRTVLEHIVSRIRRMKHVEDIILATTIMSEDDSLVTEAKRLGILVYRGDKRDVVARLLGAACSVHSETILKVNGNYPLFDPYLADDLIAEHLRGGFKFSYNEHFWGTVYGTGCYVVQKELLVQLNKRKLTAEQREAGILCLHQNEAVSKVNKFPYANPRPHYNVCFETEKDLRLIDFLFKAIEHPYIEEIIRLLDDNPILVGSNKHESIQEVGLEKLYLFPEKLAALSDRDLSTPDVTYPISIELSLTGRCNFNCIWCSDKNLRTRINGDMDFKVLKSLFSDLKQGGTKGIVIEGGGEPTIHKNFADTVTLAYDLGFGVGLITNGSTRIKDEIVDKLEWIRVSLDASTPEEQRLLKNTDTFERVMSSIKSLCSSRATVGVGYVVTSKNIGNLESLILRLRNFGVGYIQFRPVIDHKELDTNVDLSYLKRYQTSKFSVIVDGMRQNVTEGNDNLPCMTHSLTTVIASDGSVYLCGRLNIHEWLEPIGNINNQSFGDIWLGEKRREQAMMVLNPGFCREHCPRCRLTKFNQLFSRLDQTKTRNFI
jgi:radical SAM protein with 4Fe4S-binding SPASM domain